MRLDGRRVPLAIGALVLLVGAATLLGDWPVGVFEDDGIYVILAKSLATGHGYRYLNLPGLPVAAHYPPGYPLLLATLWSVWPAFPANVMLLKLANVVLLAIAAVAGYRFAREECDLASPAAALIALAGTLAIPPLLLAAMVLSETFFLALLVPSLGAAERLVRAPTTRRALVVGAMCGALALVRSLGLALLPATLLVLALRRSWRAAAIVTATAFAAILPWQLWVAAHASALPAELQGKYGSYGGWFADAVRSDGIGFFAAVAARNTEEMAATFSVLFSPMRALPVRMIVLATLACLVVLGGARLARRVPVTLGFLALYLGVVMMWPFSLRYVWGVWLPLTTIVVAGGMGVVEWATRPSPRGVARALRIAALAAVTLAVAGHVRYTVRGYRGRWWESIPRSRAEQAEPLVRWVQRHTSPGDVVATDHETIVYLYTGRPAIPTAAFLATEAVRSPDPDDDARALLALMRTYGARWLLANTRPSTQAAERLLRRSPPAIALVDTLPDGGAVFVIAVP